jgi:hypothetical protein
VDPLLNKQLIYVLFLSYVSDEGDLSRYIAGNVALESIRAVSVEHDDPPGHLSALPYLRVVKFWARFGPD